VCGGKQIDRLGARLPAIALAVLRVGLPAVGQQPAEGVGKLVPVERRMFDLGFEVLERAGNCSQIGIGALVGILVEEIGNAPQINNGIFSSVFRERIVLARVGQRISRREGIERNQVKERCNKRKRRQEPHGTWYAQLDDRAWVNVRCAALHVGKQCASHRIQRSVRRRPRIDLEGGAQLLAQCELVVGGAGKILKTGGAPAEDKAANHESHGEYLKGRF
jgi:hypothetical protein